MQMGAMGRSQTAYAQVGEDTPFQLDDSDPTVPPASSMDPTLFNTSEHGLSSSEAASRLARFGRNELEDKQKPKWKILVEQFTGPMPCMIWMAAFVEIIIRDWPNFWILVVLQCVNGGLGYHESTKAGDAVAALKASLRPEAMAKRDGIWKKINAAELVPGDLVVLGAGSAVPADSRVCPGAKPIDIDQAALTGESLPVTFHSGETAKMGSTVVRGEAEGIVTATGADTFFGKTATMIKSVDEMGHFQKILLRITFFLLFISLTLVSICMIYMIIKGDSFLKALAFGVVLLVASIPIAMPVVCTATMALGSRKLAEQKAIVSRLASIEELASMNMLCSDKTGTMTLNKMALQEELPMFFEGTSREEILQCACLAAKWKEPAKDALDTLVLNAIDLSPLNAYQQLEYVPFDPSTKRTEATLKGPDGVVFNVVKGAPNVVLDMCQNGASIKKHFEEEVNAFADRGIRCLAVAKSNAQGLQMLGVLTFLDPPRHDTKWTIDRSYEYGVGVKMITGDHKVIAKETCRALGMGTNILGVESLPDVDTSGYIPEDVGQRYGEVIERADGFAQVFPEHKFLITEALRQRGFKVGMTGDGVNDAPAIKKADIGIAVDGATDAARAAADIVLTTPGLGVIVDAIVLSRCIFNRMKNYVIYRIACTFQLLVFFFCGVMFLHPDKIMKSSDPEAPIDEELPPYFNLPVVALILITILNDGTIISIAYDFVTPSNYPEKWHLNVLFIVSTWLGMVAVFSSILLLYLGLNSHHPDSFLAGIGAGEKMPYSEIQMMIYLKISLSDFLTVFAARTRGTFYSRAPGRLLLAAACFAMCVSTLLSLHWPLQEMTSIRMSMVAFVWFYCVVWFLIQDVTKVAVYGLLWDADLECARSEYEAQLVRAKDLHTSREDAKWEKVDKRLAQLEEENSKLKKMFAAAHTSKMATVDLLANGGY
eukprot:CAMPEP_0114255710 /NCGR_PEP_ID=MMETSP0058-20121206/17717_1 /TAXON_ID=36894 /ORGANISM="Pyramimonas parkeae, CCMP726" /LENGTH=939 /DNA_ID=CAMNT_0001370133 /DNA_START=201 /DNA_END=3020 /DNA_ORIENTATION=+